jgi:hypothetical protein
MPPLSGDLRELNQRNRIASFGAELPNNRHCPTGVNLGILRNKGSRFHQRSCGDDTIGGITGKIVAQLSSLDRDQRGQREKLRPRQGQGLFQPIQNLSVQSDSPLATAVATSRQLIAETPI